MKKQKICGIYKIVNLVNRKILIGQSINITGRWYTHKWEAKNNKHDNPYFQKAWNKYGENNFKIEIITECPIEKLDEAKIGDKNPLYGKHHSPATIEKMRNAKLNKSLLITCVYVLS